MRHPKLLVLASASALACLSPLACAGPEDQPEKAPSLRKAESALTDEHTDNGTRLTAEPVGSTHCGGEGDPSVTLSGTVSTTGSVDSVELTASIDGADAKQVGVVQPQDFSDRDGRYKDAAYSVRVQVPAGSHSIKMCFVQSGAQGREEKKVCADAVTVNADCAPQDGGSGGQTDGGSGGGDNGGGGEQRDELPPVTVLAAFPQANAAGWNNTDVTVTLTATDDKSGVKEIHWALVGAETAQGVTAGDVAQIPFHNEGATAITYFAVDNAGNVEAPHVASLRIDKTAPVIAFGAKEPAANAANWNRTAVAQAFAVTDALSGVAGFAPASPLTYTVEGAGQSSLVTATDVAGNVATVASPVVNIDWTPPVVTFGALSPAPNAAGWNNTDVSIPYSAADSLSGVASASPGSPLVFSGEGSAMTATVTAVDVADNVTVAVSPAVSIDKTPPVISGGPGDNCQLWAPNHKMVQVADYSGADGLSGFNGASWNITAVSNEPQNWLGDGNTTGDTQVSGTKVYLRAERSGKLSGRIYTVTATASDAAGNSTTVKSICTVPHDQR